MFSFTSLVLTALAAPSVHLVLPTESGLTLPVADWYVDASAANCAAANGTASAPFCTIAAALVAAVNGDTVYIAAGTYFEHLTIDEDLRLVGTDGREVTFVDGSNNGRPITITTGAIVTIEGLTVQHGFVDGGGSGGHYGGGILSSGTLTLKNATVSNNLLLGTGITSLFLPNAGGCGIGIHNATGSTRIIGCIVSDNDRAYSHYAYLAGGGIFADSEVLIVGSAIARNDPTGLFLAYSGGTILDSTVSDNFGTGIAAFLSGSGSLPVQLRNSTISGNLDVGSYGYGSVVETSGVTIIDNGGGIANSSGAVVRLHNSVIARNGSDVSGACVSLGHNLIGDVGTSTGFGAPGDLIGTTAAPIDPQLGPLAAHGGPTRTHAALPGSPLIDAGDPQTFDPLDQRGYTRVGAADIGAHEFGASGGAPISGCTSAPNSTGAVGRLSVIGSTSVSADAFMLSTWSLPAQAFGFFLASRTPGFAAQPGGSAGNLCLGGAIGRFVGPGQIRGTGASGGFALALDLQRHPTPMGLVPVAPGETWHYQAWHRDSLGGAATSNFSAGTQVTFTQ